MQKRRKKLILCILIVVTVFSTLAIIKFTKTTPIPDDLIGMWVTSNPEYSSRYFGIKKDHLVFGNGQLLSDYGHISTFKKAVQDNCILYIVYYKDDQREKQQISFYYEPIDGGAIRFKNRKQIKWTKFKGDLSDWLINNR